MSGRDFCAPQFVLLFSSALAISGGLSGPAQAQESPASAAPDAGPAEKDSASVESVVVTGTRRVGVTVPESATPIDVVSSDQLTKQGASNLNDSLRTAVPSLNVQRFVAQGESAFVRPFSLRGLPPDQTLVLVNGKRRHRSAFIQITNQPLGAGAQGPDLSTIPGIAVDRVEVLRDGAAAQYGSDAIAGVINFQLKRASEGTSAIASFGQFTQGDGAEYSVQVNQGLPLGSDGFLNLSAEYVDTDITDRGAQPLAALNEIAAGNTNVKNPAQLWGNPSGEAARFVLNSELPLRDSMAAYFFGAYAQSKGRAEQFYRSPTARLDVFRSVPLTTTPGGPRFSFASDFPGGMTPVQAPEFEDASGTIGLRGEWQNGLSYDFSGSLAQSAYDSIVTNTVNPSLGPDSPNTFFVGYHSQRESQLNADFVIPWNVGGLPEPVNVAFGTEYRRERFKAREGEPASYIAGPYARVLDPDTGQFIGLAIGSSAQPGLTPEDAGVWTQSNWAAYADIEADITEKLTLGVAGRYEDFDTFGETFNWKVLGRYELLDSLALRGSYNTGFRAPTPGQSNVTSEATTIDLVNGGLLVTAQLAPDNLISQFYGARSLEEEKSKNYSIGAVLTLPGGYLFTVDYFHIEVDNRISLTSIIPITPGDRAALTALGIDSGDTQAVRFFGNYFDTETEGVDAVFSKNWAMDSAAVLGLSASLNYTKNKVTNVADARAVNRERIVEISDFNPQWRGVLGATYERGPLNLRSRASYYGEWTDAVPNAVPTAASFDQIFGSEWVLDVEASYDVTKSVNVSLGVDNVLDTYPDKDVRSGQQVNGIVYPQFSPFGFNGAFWYARANIKF